MEPRFHEGQLVVITGNSCEHGHKIDAIVKLQSATTDVNGYWSLASTTGWQFDQDDCMPLELGAL